MSKSPKNILASTLGMTMPELEGYRYHGYTGPVVYAIGDTYYAVSKKPPKHDFLGAAWLKHADQFFAGSATTIWYTRAA